MSKKATNIILIIYVIALSVLVIGATYAHFTYIKVSRVSPKVDVGAATLNFITFEIGDPIFINPTIENFKQGMKNLSSDTFASAYLRVENGEEETSINYNVFLQINENSLTYSTTNKTPELIMKVFDPYGNELDTIEGLKYVTVKDGQGNEISGFDITTAMGKYYIANNRNLKTKKEISEIWKAEVTYVNLGESQDGNLEKKLDGFIRIEKVTG